jgi:hypothetical protein
MGFPTSSWNWVATILATTSTWVALNGKPGETICHTWGLRQGDPLSTMLFLLVMEVPSALIRKEDPWNLLQELGVCSIPHRASFYVNDLIFFLRPTGQDLQLLSLIFTDFEGASSLGCNLNKCQPPPFVVS